MRLGLLNFSVCKSCKTENKLLSKFCEAGSSAIALQINNVHLYDGKWKCK
jgi:hypothetical protein